MTPKKPTLTASRMAWLASLKPGDPVLLWRQWEGWLTAQCEDQSALDSLGRGRAILVRTTSSGAHPLSAVASGSGFALYKGELDLVIFPSDDRDALAGFWTDKQRRELRNIDWHKVDDSAVQRIADLLRLDAGKEPRP